MHLPHVLISFCMRETEIEGTSQLGRMTCLKITKLVGGGAGISKG